MRFITLKQVYSIHIVNNLIHSNLKVTHTKLIEETVKEASSNNVNREEITS